MRSRDTEESQCNVESRKHTRDTARCEKLGRYEAELLKDGDHTNLHLSTEIHQNETSQAASLRSSMLPPTLKAFVETSTQRPESSTASTVPFDTLPKLTQTGYAGSSEFSTSNDHMPTPTVSSKTRSDAEKPLDSSQSSAKSKNRSSAQTDASSLRFEKHAELESSDSLPPSKRTRTVDVSAVLSSAEQHEKLQEDAIQRDGLPDFASRVDSLVHSLPFTTNRAAIPTALKECGGNMDLAASRLLDAEEQGGGHDELSLCASTPAMGSARTRSSKSYKKRELEGKQHNDELGSEEIEIGFPKEQYQPRPSRSRSGQGEVDDLIIPVDFSKRPEALVKPKKSKRRKTTALAKATPKYEEDEEDTPLFDVPKSIKFVDSEVKTTPDSTNLANTELPWADPEAQGGHEVISTATLPALKKQRGRPHKKSTDPQETFSEERPLIDHEDEEPDADIPENLLAKALPEASKPCAPKKPRGRPVKKATGSSEEISEEQRFADEHEEEPDENLGKDLQGNHGDHEVASEAETPVAKKQRGRPKKKPAKPLKDIPSDNDENEEPPQPSKPPSTKNPRKRKKPTPQASPVLDNDDDDDDPPPLLNKPSEPTPLSETKADTNPVRTSTAIDNPSPPPTPLAKQHPQQPETPHKPSNVAQQKGPDKHSPLQSGKVRYRVGLSKRARIEPLLRVVRK